MSVLVRFDHSVLLSISLMFKTDCASENVQMYRAVFISSLKRGLVTFLVHPHHQQHQQQKAVYLCLRWESCQLLEKYGLKLDMTPRNQCRIIDHFYIIEIL